MNTELLEILSEIRRIKENVLRLDLNDAGRKIMLDHLDDATQPLLSRVNLGLNSFIGGRTRDL
jgi:hypothetical protein